jgi:DNA modification methylase
MILQGDLFDVLPTLKGNSIDACITDGPYGIGFMGKEWDTFKPSAAAKRHQPNKRIESDNPNLKGRTRAPASSPSQIQYDMSAKGLRRFQEWTEWWAYEVYRVLKPGAYLLSCGAPRSFHRMACGIEDAGFEIRDCLSWLYGQGFPKSLNIAKAVAKKDADAAAAWDGWGTALKPGWEPIVVARKPLEGTVAENVLTFGPGGLNVDACRLGSGDGGTRDGEPSAEARYTERGGTNFAMKPGPRGGSDLGRWPANAILDTEAAALVDEQSGESVSTGGQASLGAFRNGDIYGKGRVQIESCDPGFGDSGGASRFFYVPKPDRAERDMGCEQLSARTGGEATNRVDGSAGTRSPRAGAGRTGGARNIHPTVKPVELMRWLVRLVTPPGGVVLDHFLGSGTTGIACKLEQRPFIGIEREAAYIPIIEARIAAAVPLFDEVIHADTESVTASLFEVSDGV